MNAKGLLETYLSHHSKYLRFVSDFSTLPVSNIDSRSVSSELDSLPTNTSSPGESEALGEVKNAEPDTPPETYASHSISDATTLDELKNLWGDCKRCPLSETRNKIVFGEGGAHSRLMLIGEGPGANEDRTGRPFVGRAGDLLTKMIEAMGLNRQDVYIANIVKCRPPGNRDPLPSEIVSCIGALKMQISIIKPELILCLGRVSAQTLLSDTRSMKHLRGHFHKYAETLLAVTYHPSYLLRNPDAKKDAWSDLQMIMKKLGLEKNG
ncbi:MAG: uracil-DNA glycosylase [Deltaproteobacteria bacterium]|nr:uracil-DNA glycosylase [Deltaproteobacteria bacterium]